MRAAARIVRDGRSSLAAIGFAVFVAFIVWCFEGYLTPAALVSLLTGLSFCG